MKKIKQSLFCFLLCGILATQALTVDAHENISSSDEITVFYSDLPSENEALPRAVDYCNGGNHDMLSNAFGTVVNRSTGATIIGLGALYQCTHCHLVLICEGEPPSSAIGRYTTYQASERVTSNVTVLYVLPSQVYQTNSKTLTGMSFRF